MDLQELRRKLDIAQQHVDKQELYSAIRLDQETIDLLLDLMPSTTGEAGQLRGPEGWVTGGPKPEVTPTVGRIVHVHYDDCCLPAIVTKVREYSGESFKRVDVTEFRPRDVPRQLNSVPPSPIPIGWHWPQECPDGR